MLDASRSVVCKAGTEAPVVTASVVITTRNRWNDVLRAIGSCLAQDCPVEVLVYDDCSSDGTADAVRSMYPQIRFYRSEEKRSATVWRNNGFREAAGEIVFSLDDDSYFTAPTIVSDIIAHFESSPKLAVVGIPYVEPYATSLHAPVPLVAGQQIAAYTACAAAFRRSAVLEAGGYRECFEYAGEEGDLAIRLRALGFELIQGDSAPVVHSKSPRRDQRRQSALGIRNHLYFVWFNFPVEHALARSLTYLPGFLTYRFRLSDIPFRLWCLAKGCVATILNLDKRQPVSRACYRAYRALPSHSKSLWRGGTVPPPCHELPKE